MLAGLKSVVMIESSEIGLPVIGMTSPAAT
jgi:hypothetical protein